MPRPLLIAVLCGGIIMSLTFGIRQSFGLFLAPVSLDLGTGRELFALGIGLMNLAWGLGAPFAGAIADRFGAARVAAAGMLAYAAGLAVMTGSGEGAQLLLGGLLIGVGLSGAGFTVVLGAVARAAPPDKQSLALGLASMGGSIGQFAALPVAQLLIDTGGWVQALLVIAAAMLIALPLAAGLRRPAPVASAHAAGRQGLRAALVEAWLHNGFRLLVVGFFVCGFHLAFVAVHLPAYVIDLGYPPWLATHALMLVGICNIIGTWLCGYLGQHHSRKNVLTVLYLARALVFLLFLAVPVSEASILVFGAAMGFLWLGTVPLTSGLVAVIFGPAYLSTLFGIVFLSHQLGGFLGSWLAGLVHDVFRSYDIMWWVSVVLGLAAAALHWPIREEPLQPSPASPPQARETAM